MTYTQPLILLCTGIALVFTWRLRQCRGWWVPMLAVALLALLCWAPAAWLLSRPLEGGFPIRPFHTTLPYGAIVVLSSAVSPPQFERPYALPDEDTFHRCRFAAWVYSLRSVPVLACGGPGGPNQPSNASVMRGELAKGGVPDRMIWTEERSGSTRENALFGSRMLNRSGVNRIVLVTDATSMIRARACFLKEGMEVIPAPSDFYEPEYPMAFVPGWRAIRQNELALHEGIGLLWYRMRGWI